jgi:hypothetical protein
MSEIGYCFMKLGMGWFAGSYSDKAPFHKEYEESKTGWEEGGGGGGGE